MSAAASDTTGQAEGWTTAVAAALKGCARQAVKRLEEGDERLSISLNFYTRINVPLRFRATLDQRKQAVSVPDGPCLR